MHVALAYRSMFIVLLNRLVYYFHRRLVYSAQIRIMSSPLCKLSWQVLVRKELYSGVKCSRVGLYKEGCVMLIVSCAVWLVSVSPVLFYLYKERELGYLRLLAGDEYIGNRNNIYYGVQESF